MAVTEGEIRAFLERRFARQLEALNIGPGGLPDDLDLVTRGVIDSLGLVELIAALDEEFGLAVDFEDLDPDQLTVVGPFCRHVAQQGGGS